MSDAETTKRGNTGPLWRVGVQSFDDEGLPIEGQLEDLSLAGWACTIAVPTAESAISRAVTVLSADNTRFLAQLTPAETETMNDELHVVAIEVTNPNTTPAFNIEHHVELIIENQLIPTP
jgi:hypothetical protein